MKVYREYIKRNGGYIMEETFNTDIIDGKVINWDKLSTEEISKIKNQAEKKENEIIEKIINIFNNVTEE